MNPFPSFTRWDLIAMCVALAAVFGLEMLGVFGRNDVTITAICRSFCPRAARAVICVWLFWHMVLYGWVSNKSWLELVKAAAKKVVLL